NRIVSTAGRSTKLRYRPEHHRSQSHRHPHPCPPEVAARGVWFPDAVTPAPFGNRKNCGAKEADRADSDFRAARAPWFRIAAQIEAKPLPVSPSLPDRATTCLDQDSL